MTSAQPTFFGFTLKTIIVHTVTYFLVGLAALTVFDYSARFSEPPLVYFMRPSVSVSSSGS